MLAYEHAALPSLLGSLNTLVGLSWYAVLWTTTWWCTRRVVKRLDWAGLTQHRTGELLWRASVAGGLNGVLFFGGLAISATVGLAVESISRLGFGSVLSSVFSAAIAILGISPVGLLFAFPIGAVVGVLFGLLDGLVLRAANHLYLDCTRPVTPGDRC